MPQQCPDCGVRAILYREKIHWGAGKIIRCQACGTGFQLPLNAWQGILVFGLGTILFMILAWGVGWFLDSYLPSAVAGVLALLIGGLVFYGILLAWFVIRPLQRHPEP